MAFFFFLKILSTYIVASGPQKPISTSPDKTLDATLSAPGDKKIYIKNNYLML